MHPRYVVRYHDSRYVQHKPYLQISSYIYSEPSRPGYRFRTPPCNTLYISGQILWINKKNLHDIPILRPSLLVKPFKFSLKIQITSFTSNKTSIFPWIFHESPGYFHPTLLPCRGAPCDSSGAAPGLRWPGPASRPPRCRRRRQSRSPGCGNTPGDHSWVRVAWSSSGTMWYPPSDVCWFITN